VGRSATTVFAARLLAAGANWLSTVVIARNLSTGDFGAFAFIFGLLGIIGLVVDLQVSRVVIQDILDAGDDAGEIVGSYVTLRVLIGLLAYGAAMVIVVAGGYPPDIVLGTAVAGFGFLAVAPANGMAIWFQARLWMRPTALASIIGAAVQLSLVAAFAASGNGTVVLFSATLVVAEIGVLLLRIWSVHAYGLRVRLSLSTTRWWIWLRESIPLAIGFSLVSVYYKVDILLLSQLDSLSSVGKYTVGYKFADLAGYLPFALLTPVMTLMVGAWPHSSHVVRRHFSRAWMLLFLSGTGIAVGFALVASPLIELLYGTRYESATGASTLLVFAAAIQFFSYLCFTTLASIGRNVAYAIGGAVGLVVNVAMNLVLIPELSFDGAAIATVATEILVVLLLLGALVRVGGLVSLPWRAMTKITVAAGVMAAAYVATDRVAPWFVALAVSGAVFLGMLHVLRVEGPGGLLALWRAARFDVDEDPDAGQTETPSSR
jgi:O-antigen/teichoic acid export membrane protein